MTASSLFTLKSPPAVTLKAGLYLRVSSAEQALGHSLDHQRDVCLAHATKLGAEVADLYTDPGFSATSANRPAFLRLVADAEAGRINVIIVSKLDRFARNRFDSALFKQRLAKAGVRVLSVTEPIDDSPSGVMLEGVLEAVAHWYSVDLKVKVTDGLRLRAQKGLSNGRPSFGYRRPSDAPQSQPPAIVPEEAAAVRRAFEAFASGTVSYREIAQRFNAEGFLTRHYPTRRAADGPRLWTGDSIRALLKNPAYRGAVLYRGEELPGKHEPIVTPELWHQANAVGSRLRVRNTPWKPARLYWLAGILRCAGCSSNLQGNHSNSGERFRYYREVGKRRGLPCEQPQIAVRADKIEAEVDTIVAGFSTPPAVRKRVLQLLSDGSEPKDAEAKQRQLQERLRRLARLYEQGDMDDAEYDAKRRALRVELDRVTLPPRKADEAISQFDVLQLAWSRATPQEKRALGLALFEAIYYDLAAMAITEVVVQPAFRPWVQR